MKVSENAKCDGCPLQRLYPSNTFVAPKLASGASDLIRLVVAESPGREEQELGEPLVGGSGRIFNTLLSRAAIERSGLTILNTIQCRPPDNIYPTDSNTYISKDDGERAVSHCMREHVWPVIEGTQWKRIDILGGKSLKALTGKDEIYKWRGSPLDIVSPNGVHRVGIPTIHPSAIMRDMTMFPVVVNDLMKSVRVPEEYYEPFPSLEDVKNFQFTTFAFDIETPKYREMGPHAPVEMVGLCAKGQFAMCVPVKGAYTSELKRIFANAKQVIGHNSLQFDLPKLEEQLGIRLNAECIHWDTMLVHHLLFPQFSKLDLSTEDESDAKSNGGGHDLEFLGTQFTSKPAWKDNRKVIQIYNCRDVDITFQAWQQMLPMLRVEGLEDLYLYTQVPLAKICHLMTTTGFKVDPKRIHEAAAALKQQIADEEKYLPDALKTYQAPIRKRQPAPPGTLGKSGKPVKFIHVPDTKAVVPWRSTSVKLEYFYGSKEGSLSLDVVRDPKKKTVTTGKLAISKLIPRLRKVGKDKEARAVQAIGTLNKLDELVTTFCTEDMAKIERLHAQFNVHGTASGRLSSSNPNLQNIPEKIRILYIPSCEGWKIIDVDFSNIENRLTARLADDIDRLAKYDDPKHSDYKVLVTRAWGIPYDEVVKDNSREAPYGKAKAIVLGVNYGLGKKKISDMYDIEPKEVDLLMSTWKREIKYTTLWQERTAEEARINCELTNPFGRKNYFYSNNAYTQSLSFLPQSTAADIIFRCMIALMYTRIGWPESAVQKIVSVYKPLPQPARLLLQVHDALTFEAPRDIVDEVVDTIKLVFEQPWPQIKNYIVPCNVTVGESWGECRPYETKHLVGATN